MTEKKSFNLKKYVPPAFLVMLAVSFSMWYFANLNKTYTAEVPVWMDIDGNKFKVTCMAEGSGYRLLSHRVFRQSRVELRFSEVETSPSVINEGYFVVHPLSLQTQISLRNSDISIKSVGDIPEIKYNGQRR